MNNKFNNFTSKEKDVTNEQILNSKVFEPNIITSAGSTEINSTSVSDPNHIVEKAFSELTKLPKDVLDKLGEVKINIEYQLVPSIQVKFKK